MCKIYFKWFEEHLLHKMRAGTGEREVNIEILAGNHRNHRNLRSLRSLVSRRGRLVAWRRHRAQSLPLVRLGEAGESQGGISGVDRTERMVAGGRRRASL